MIPKRFVVFSEFCTEDFNQKRHQNDDWSNSARRQWQNFLNDCLLEEGNDFFMWDDDDNASNPAWSIKVHNEAARYHPNHMITSWRIAIMIIGLNAATNFTVNSSFSVTLTHEGPMQDDEDDHESDDGNLGIKHNTIIQVDYNVDYYYVGEEMKVALIVMTTVITCFGNECTIIESPSHVTKTTTTIFHNGFIIEVKSSSVS